MAVLRSVRTAVFSAGALLAAAAWAGPSVSQVEGKYTGEDGNPTWHKSEDGTWDWYTFSGYRRYHSECHVCHGPDGEGSSYAPGLRVSLTRLSYGEFLDTVVNGRVVHRADKESVMPAFGTNKNVMCYIDDIYVYLKARADGALERTRPEKHEPKLDSIRKSEDSCMSG